MMTRKYMSAATVSWIDSATGLPETDAVPVVSPTVTRGFLVGSKGFRFTNFMEVYADLDTRSNAITSYGFTNASGMYRGPSYMKIPSHAFLVDQRSHLPTVYQDGNGTVTFLQTVGARTVSPEIVGGTVGVAAGAGAGALAGTFVFPAVGTAIGAIAGAVLGGLTGEVAGHQFIGFSPIWTMIQIDIPIEGEATARLLHHSLFPSMTFYVQPNMKAPSAIARPTASAGTLITTHGAPIGRASAPGAPPALARPMVPAQPVVVATPVLPFAGPFVITTVNDSGATYYNATKDVEQSAWEERGWGKLNKGGQGATAGNPWSIEKGVFGAGSSCPN